MMKFLPILLLSISTSVFSQNALLLELSSKPQLGKTIKVKLKAKKVKKRGIKYRSVRAKNVEVAPSVGSFNKGAISLPNEADNLLDHSIKLLYRDLSKPSKWYDTLVRLDYSGKILANFNGKNGVDGEDAANRLGIFRIGRDGSDGGNGGNGKPGGHGQDIVARVTATYDSIVGDTLVKVIVKTRIFERASTYLFSANSGSLVISSIGGRGGSGGDGGNGSDGKGAKPATEKKSSKSAGCGGDGGHGGTSASGGNGGSILVEVEPSARNYAKLITLVNKGGKGGSGGVGGSAGSGGSSCEGQQAGPKGEEGDSQFGSRKGRRGPAPEIVYLDTTEQEP